MKRLDRASDLTSDRRDDVDLESLSDNMTPENHSMAFRLSNRGLIEIVIR